MFKNYHEYITKNPNSFISKIYGLHKIKIIKNKNKIKRIYFFVTENIFSSTLSIDHRYELKGIIHKLMVS